MSSIALTLLMLIAMIILNSLSAHQLANLGFVSETLTEWKPNSKEAEVLFVSVINLFMPQLAKSWSMLKNAIKQI